MDDAFGNISIQVSPINDYKFEIGTVLNRESVIRCRELLTGIATFGECTLVFLASWSHLSVEDALSIPGSTTFYAIVSGVG